MKVSDEGIDFIIREEGQVLHVYRDQGGLPTIGVGHLLTKSELMSGKILIGGVPVRYAPGLTVSAVKALLRQDLERVEVTLQAYIRVPLTQSQFDALASWVFNVGGGAFRDSTLLKLLNREQYDAVPAQLRRWIHGGGRVLPVLQGRREREIKLWEGEA
jgi:lysozyme